MKTLNSAAFVTPMFFRPQIDGRCLVFGVLQKTPDGIKSDAVVNITSIADEYRDAPKMVGKSYPTVLSEGWRGVIP